MKLSSIRLLVILCCLGLLSVAASCGSKSSPAAPTPTPTPAPAAPVMAPTIAAPTLKTPIGGVQLTTLLPTLAVTNAEVTGEAGDVTYEFEVSELDTFPVGSRTSSQKGILQVDDGPTTWTPPSNLLPNFKYNWHARAKAANITDPTDWSKTETFVTNNQGFKNGFSIYDPLNNGTTVGARNGGQFITGANGGWQANSLTDSIDYNIPTCNDCTAEFDVTNFGAGEGSSISVDVKWFSMGDGSQMSPPGLNPFRDSPWKMHLEQRSDGDGTGMQVIWRNGAADADTGGDPEYGDHRGKYPNGGPNWGHSFDNKVWHFRIKWTPTSYEIFINELGKPDQRWFPGAGDSGRFGGGHSYSPGNMRVQFGCPGRSETMIGARFRNFKLSHN
jgi:hypothetical protein